MIGYEHYWPKREITPKTELACLVIAGVCVIPVLVGFGIVKMAKWIESWGDNGYSKKP